MVLVESVRKPLKPLLMLDQRSQLLNDEREKHQNSGKSVACSFTTDYLQSKIDKAREDGWRKERVLS